MDTRTLGLMNGRSRRMMGIRPLLAMTLATTAVSLAVQDPVSAATQDGLRIKNVASATAKSSQADEPQFLVRTARVPIFVDIDLGAAGGTPAVPDDAVDRVVAALDANPRRLITLRFKGGALRFNDLTRSTREALLDKKGNEVIDAYNGYMAGQVRRLIGEVDAARTGAPIAVQGIPFEGGSIEVASANRAYRRVIDRLNAIVVAGGIMLSGSSDEVGMLRRSYPQAIAASDNRAIMFAANGGWKIATLTEGDQDADESVADAASDSNELTLDDANEIDLAAGIDAVDGSAILGSIASADVPSVGQGEGSSPPGNEAGGGNGNSGFGLIPSRGGSGSGGGGAAPADPQVGGNASLPSDLGDAGEQGNDPTEAISDEPGDDGETVDAASESVVDESEEPIGGDWDPEDEVIDSGESSDSSGEDDSHESTGSDAGSNDDSSSGEDGAAGDESSSNDSSSGSDGASGETDMDGDADSTSDSNSGSGAYPWGAGDVAATWESSEVLQDLLDAASDQSIVDITGRGFYLSQNDNPLDNAGKSIAIQGGHICGAPPLSWDSMGGGLFRAHVPALSVLDDFRLYLLDEDAAEYPLLGVTPEPGAGKHRYRMTYNENWWLLRDDRNEGLPAADILTSQGDNVPGGTITGVRVHDSAVRQQIQEAIGTGDGSIAMYHSDANLITSVRVASWSPSTGTMTFATGNNLVYWKYFRMCFLQSPDRLREAGTYTFDPVGSWVYYRPADGDPTGARVPVSATLFDHTGGNLSFSGTTFSGGVGAAASGLVRSGFHRSGGIAFERCRFTGCYLGVYSAQAVMQGCVADRISNRGFFLHAGSQVEGCHVKDTENLEAFVVMATDSDPLSPLPQTVFRHNWISVPASAHGQAISLYKDCWQNASVEHNIFYNCVRALSFQPNRRAQFRRASVYEFRFCNNLVVTDATAGPLPGGQSVVSFNGDKDSHLGPGQLVLFRHNTIFTDLRVVDDPKSASTWSVELAELVNSRVEIESNLLGSVDASMEVGGAQPHWRYRNQLMIDPPRYGAAWGEMDLGTPWSLGDVFDADALTPVGLATTAAADGGAIGIRWSRIPSIASVRDLSVDWYLDYPAEVTPVAPDHSVAWWGQDRR